MTSENVGPRELFAERFALLYAEAGDPPLKRVTESVARARRLDERGQLVRIPAQRVSDWRRGRNVPARFGALAAVLEVLIGEARKIRPRPVADGLYDLRAWRSLWEQAQAGAAGDTPGEAVVCPYLGLAAFGPDEARWFFGRERATAALVERVAAARSTGGIVMLVGASGAGKSSLLHAGLVPALAAVEGLSDWPVVVGTPGADPLKELCRQLPGLEDCLDATGADLDTLVRQELPAGVVVVVDQFEELFTLCESEAARRTYVQVLQAICTPPGRGVVVLGLRADVYGRCLDHPELVPALQDRQLVLGPMTAAELRDAVLRPAKAVGLRLEDGLVELLLKDLGADSGNAGRAAYDAGALPLLSHALLATWQRRQSGRLTVAGYRAAGGIHGAVATTAERAWAQLGSPGQGAAAAMLLGLVRVGEDGQDTRRRSTREALSTRVGGRAVAEDALETLATARLITLDAASVEITHEALLRAWPRLRGWIDRDRAGMLARQRLEEDALSWSTEARDPSLLYRGARLEAGLASAADPAGVSPLAREFLTVSTRYRRRAAWIRRAVVAVIAIFALIATTTAVIALRQRDDARFRQIVAEADRLQETDPSLAAQLLLVARELRPDDKDIYTRLLSTQHTPLATTLRGHTGAVYLTSFSPDGRLLATASEDRTARLWDVHDRTHPVPLGPLTGHTSWVSSAVFSPDGRALATAGDDHMIRLWNITDPARPTPIGQPRTGDNGTIYLLAFSPDGRTLATANEDRTVRLWDVRDPTRAAPLGAPLAGAGSQVRSIAISPGSTLLAVSGDDHIVRLWNIADPTHPVPYGRFLVGHEDTVHSVAFSPDGRTLASGSDDETIRLWDVSDPSTAHPLGAPLIGHAGGVWSVAFRADGRLLVSAGSDGTARLWNVANPVHAAQIGQPLAGNGAGLFAVGLSPDGTTLATGSGDNTVRIWSLPATVLIGHTGDARRPVFTRDGRVLATASGDRTARLWNVADPARPEPFPQALEGHASYVDTVAFSPDGRILVSASGDRTVRVWNVSDPAHPVLLGHPVVLNTRFAGLTGISPDGRVLATPDDDRSVRLWDMTDPTRPDPVGPPLRGHTGYLNHLAFSPDGRLLATSGQDKLIQLWNVADPAHPRLIGEPLTGHTADVLRVAFSPDGRLLASSSADKSIRLWDIADPGRPRAVGHPITGHAESVNSVAFSPNGRMLISGGRDGTIRLWDVADPANPARYGQPITAHVPATFDAAFTPDGHFVATGSDDAVVRLWDLDVDRVIHRICASTRGILTPEQWTQYVPHLSYNPPCGR